MEAELGKDVIEIPERLAVLADKEKVATKLGTGTQQFHDWLRSL